MGCGADAGPISRDWNRQGAEQLRQLYLPRGCGLPLRSGAHSSACPAVVKSANGDSYEITGAGTLTTQSKSVTETFTHKSSNGLVIEAGVWIASELASFDSYGIAPGALMRDGRALGPRQMDLSRGLGRSPAPWRQAAWPCCASASCCVGDIEKRDAASELCPRQSSWTCPRF